MAFSNRNHAYFNRKTNHNKRYVATPTTQGLILTKNLCVVDICGPITTRRGQFLRSASKTHGVLIFSMTAIHFYRIILLAHSVLERVKFLKGFLGGVLEFSYKFSKGRMGMRRADSNEGRSGRCVFARCQGIMIFATW